MSDVIVNLNSKVMGTDTSQLVQDLGKMLSIAYGHPVAVKVSEVTTDPEVIVSLNDFHGICGVDADELMGEALQVCANAFRNLIPAKDIKILMINSTLVY